MTEVINSKIKYTLFYILYLIIVWSVYRLSGIVLPQEVDEFLVKPVIWLLPVGFLVVREHKTIESLGITKKNLLPGVYLAVILGLVFAVEGLVVGYIKNGSLDFAANLGDKPIVYLMFISLGTAISEEIVFRGFIFNRFLTYFKNEAFANLITSVLWVFIHVPATFAVLGYSPNDAISFWLLAFLYSVGACFIFARTKNVFAAILLYVLWEAPIILFR